MKNLPDILPKSVKDAAIQLANTYEYCDPIIGNGIDIAKERLKELKLEVKAYEEAIRDFDDKKELFEIEKQNAIKLLDFYNINYINMTHG